LFTELGESTPEIDEVVEHASEPQWALSLDDGLVLIIDLVQGQGTLSLCTSLGRPLDDERLRVWEAMLVYSSVYQNNGGISMALDQPGGECQMLSSLAAFDLDVDRLRRGILDLAHKARLWREVVASGADPMRAPPQAREAFNAVWG